MKKVLSAITNSSVYAFWLYFVVIVIAECLTIFVFPLAGIVSYSLIMIVFIIQSVFIQNSNQRNLLLALSLVPLVRILSLALPLGQLSLVFRFPLIYAPLLAATIAVMWATGLRPAETGINLRYWPYQVAGGVIAGFGIGITEYLIIGTSPLINTFSLEAIWLPALLIIISTGLVEELMFRGVLQKLSEAAMGRQGIIYISLLFAILHLGFYSWQDVVFVFLVALFFAAIVKRTGSLLGAILAHGIANTTLFLIAPFILS
jgi:uncharacterized protein